VILALPLFAALGRSRELGWTYFVGAPLLILPYLVIPAAVGAALALLLTAWFPPRKMIRYSIVLVLIGATFAAVFQRLYGFQHLLYGRESAQNELAQMMRFMGVGDVLFLPSGWLGRGLHALELRDWSETGLWALALWSTAAMGLVVCDWLAGPLYYQGWANARATSNPSRGGRANLYRFFDRLLGALPPSIRAMVTKDLTVFWRDPAQWGQLMILFGLLFIYFINLRSASGMGQFKIFVPFWQSLISLFNIGATAFVLSILTTRFVYPMLSLEGKQQWVIGLAPLGRTRVVWVKFILSWISSTLLTVPLALLSCAMLKTDRVITGLALATVLVVSLGLSSLAVGLGALMPNFAEDNPSRIANGVGGTLNAIISLLYVGLTLVLEAPGVQAYVIHPPAPGLGRTLVYASLPAWVALQLAMIVVPLALGLRHWKKIEF
jgi:ABC-2 type transport system permease protein